jgi:hypothetical protein
MATTYKVLGQAAPANTENANLYTVPSATSTVVSELHVANTTSSDATFRIYVRINGAAAADSNAWAKDVALAANSVFSAVAGLTLSAGDILTVRSSTGSALTFMAFGSELS